MKPSTPPPDPKPKPAPKPKPKTKPKPAPNGKIKIGDQTADGKTKVIDTDDGPRDSVTDPDSPLGSLEVSLINGDTKVTVRTNNKLPAVGDPVLKPDGKPLDAGYYFTDDFAIIKMKPDGTIERYEKKDPNGRVPLVLSDESLIYAVIGDDGFSQGTEIQAKDGSELPKGDYLLFEGGRIFVDGGQVANIRSVTDTRTPIELENGNKIMLVPDLQVGAAVENENMETVLDGTYTQKDTQTNIIVAQGKVKSMNNDLKVTLRSDQDVFVKTQKGKPNPGDDVKDQNGESLEPAVYYTKDRGLLYLDTKGKIDKYVEPDIKGFSPTQRHTDRLPILLDSKTVMYAITRGFRLYVGLSFEDKDGTQKKDGAYELFNGDKFDIKNGILIALRHPTSKRTTETLQDGSTAVFIPSLQPFAIVETDTGSLFKDGNYREDQGPFFIVLDGVVDIVYPTRRLQYDALGGNTLYIRTKKDVPSVGDKVTYSHH